MESQELINILVNAFGKNSKIKNSAIKKIYSFSKKMLNCTNEEKIDKIKPFIESNHIYPKYWGAIIALSYNVLVETSIRELIYILDINPKEYDLPLDLNMLKADAGDALYHFKRFGKIGSFPGHNDTRNIILPNYENVVKYYKRKYNLK